MTSKDHCLVSIRHFHFTDITNAKFNLAIILDVIEMKDKDFKLFVVSIAETKYRVYIYK